MVKDIEPLIAAEMAAIESMTPMELHLEYTRVLHELPPDKSSRADLIKQVLVKLRQDLK
jgi:hypothetical protein